MRKIALKLNKFPKTFNSDFLFNSSTKTYNQEVEINLLEFTALYFIEEFNDSKKVLSHCEFPALNYLINCVEEFKFKSGHPGNSKDSRKENSRILGQTMCRLVVNNAFNQPYIAHIGDLLGKKLPPPYSDFFIKRKIKGDTPDFIFMHGNAPCLAEAKGSRLEIPFSNSKFTKWREQFTRIEVIDNRINEAIEVKGYITELAIANEKNKMDNSTLFIEDPILEGYKYLEGNLDKLIYLAHYQRIFANSYLNYIGNSLLSDKKLLKEKKIIIRTYLIRGLESINEIEIVPIFSSDHLLFPYSRPPRQHNNHFIIGIKKDRLVQLINIARGEQNFQITESKLETFNSVYIKLKDEIVYTSYQLLEFNGDQEI